MRAAADRADDPAAAEHTRVPIGVVPAGVPLFNFFSLGAGEGAARGIAFFAMALLARRLGPDAFGVLGFATAVTSYFIIAANAGLQDVASRRSPDAAKMLRESPRVWFASGSSWH